MIVKPIAAGTRFGRLEVLGKTDELRQKGCFVYRCLCDCGQTADVVSSNLRTGSTRSCGCIKREQTTALGRGAAEWATKHGGARLGHRHPLYGIWAGIRHRCNDPGTRAYKYYGGRGITVCARWDDFALFVQDMGQRPSLKHSVERIDNDGNYEPANCRWATMGEQAANKRRRGTAS